MEIVFDFDVVRVQAGGVDCSYQKCIVEVYAGGLCVLKPADVGGIRVTHISNIFGTVLRDFEPVQAEMPLGEVQDDEIPF